MMENEYRLSIRLKRDERDYFLKVAKLNGYRGISSFFLTAAMEKARRLALNPEDEIKFKRILNLT